MRNGDVLVCFKGDTKNIYEYRAGKEVRIHYVEGVKKIIKEFKNSYLIVVTFEKRNEKNDKSSDKYNVQIIDTVNQFMVYS